MKSIAPKERNRRKPNLYRLLAVGFALIILTGAILLTLPVSSAEGISTPFEDALLTATSAKPHLFPTNWNHKSQYHNLLR